MQIQPTPDYQYQQNFIQKQKSWDNLSAKAVGGYGYGYEYISTPGGNSNSLKSTGHQYTNPQHGMEPHSMCGGYRVHPQQQAQQVTHHNMVPSGAVGGSNSNPGNRKPVYQHYGMKGASTNTDASYPCQHVHPQQQQMSSATTSTTIITSTSTHNNKSLDNSNGLMMTKCMKGEHCTASGCSAGGVPANVSGCPSNVAKK